MQRVRKGDLVQVITGEGRKRRGRVLRVLTKHNKIIVEGVNEVWKHLRRSQENPQGGRVQREAPIDISNVMVVSAETDKAQRVRFVSFRATDPKGKMRTWRYRVGAKDGKPMSARDKELAEKHQASEAQSKQA